ncbi:hypothetical protein [Streptomyces sp. NPDC051214]
MITDEAELTVRRRPDPRSLHATPLPVPLLAGEDETDAGEPHILRGLD